MTAVGQRVVDDRVLPAPFGRAITMQSGGRRSRSAIPKAYEPKPRKHSPNEVPDLLQRCRSQSQKDVWFAMSTLRRRTLVSRHYSIDAPTSSSGFGTKRTALPRRRYAARQ